MANDFFTLHCPDPTCQNPNPDFAEICQRCGTPLQRRYLWVVGEGGDRWAIGDTVGSVVGNATQPRYAVVAPRIVLDMQPALLPDSPLDISLEMEPYLRLVHHRLAVPQIYGILPGEAGGEQPEWLLLERAPLQADGGTGLQVGPPTPLPRLIDRWADSSALRQLNWVWQMAMLWTDLLEEKVATTLLMSEHLRVEGDIVRLLELTLDRRTMPTLADLGQLWEQWLPTTQPDIQDFLTEICQQLTTRKLSEGKALVQVLDAALHRIGQGSTRQIGLATQTDQGPTRKRNEDACHPPTGTVWSLTNPGIDQTPLPLVIVCDGIGGHEGGNVASGLAIATVQTYLQTALPDKLPPPASTIIARMEQAVLAANDEIAQRNDQEKRHERQRMGTTVVMALLQHHEVYLTHVGDSRAYRITRSNCHQVTLDDDLASREARLGYALYRHALQKPASGALIQALGMGGSTLLHPSTSRFVLDEDCLFLLCSDGLSDRDLIDRIWQTDLLPVLDGTLDVAVAAQRLVAIANSQNGHDNVTVGLIHCQVNPPTAQTPVSADLVSTSLAQSLPSPASPTRPPVAADPTSTQATAPVAAPPVATKVIPLPKPSRQPLLGFLGILGLWAIGCGLAYLLLPNVRLWADTLRGAPPPSPSDPFPSETSPPPPVVVPDPPASPVAALPLDRLIQVNRAALDAAGKSLPISLVPQPTTPTAAIPQVLPVGTVLQISSRQTIPQRGAWLKIKVCTVPDEVPPQANVPSPGSSGWVAEAEITPLVNPTPTVMPAQAGNCKPSTASPPVPLIPPPTP